MWRDHFAKKQKWIHFFDEAASLEKLPHAMLLYGPEGAGQLAHALYLIKLIFCTNKQEHGPCGQCRNCGKSDKMIHSDLHLLIPNSGSDLRPADVTKKWIQTVADQPYINTVQWMQTLGLENKLANINAKDIGKAYIDLQIQAYEGGPKVLLIWMAEYLGKDGNRLLKLIEEPPDNTYVIMTTTDRSRFLDTILSRCQQYYFPPYSDDELEEILKEKNKLSAQEISQLVKIAGGNMHTALNPGKMANNAFDKLMGNWIKACLNQDPSRQVKWAETAAKLSREEQRYFVRYALSIFEEVLRKKYGLSKGEPMTSEEKMVHYLAQRMQVEGLQNMTKRLNTNNGNIGRNANARIMWLDTCIAFNRTLNGQKARKMSTSNI